MAKTIPAPKKRVRTCTLNYTAPSDKHVAFHQARKNNRRILMGGVGTGKSMSCAFEILYALLDNNSPYQGTKALVVSYTAQHAREQILPLFLAILTNEKNGKNVGFVKGLHYTYTVSPPSFKFWNGSEIMFHSLEGGSTIPGFNVSIAFADEINQANDDSAWNAIYDRIGRDLKAPGKGFIIGTANPPPNRNHWLAQRYFNSFQDNGSMPPDTWLEQLTIYDNPFLKEKWDGWEQQYAHSELQRQRFLLGRIVNMEGLVFSAWTPERDTYDRTKQTGVNNWICYRGLDFGGVAESACVWIGKDPATEIFYVYREYYETGTSPITNTKAILRKTYPQEHVLKTYSDHAMGDRLTYKECGLDLIPADKRPGNESSGAKLINQLFETGRLKIASDLRNMIREIESYQYDPRTGKPKINQQDHLLDALRYCIWEVAGKHHNYSVVGSHTRKPVEPIDETRQIFAYLPNGKPLYVNG